MTFRDVSGSVFCSWETRALPDTFLARLPAEHGEEVLQLFVHSSRKALHHLRLGQEDLRTLGAILDAAWTASTGNADYPAALQAAFVKSNFVNSLAGSHNPLKTTEKDLVKALQNKEMPPLACPAMFHDALRALAGPFCALAAAPCAMYGPTAWLAQQYDDLAGTVQAAVLRLQRATIKDKRAYCMSQVHARFIWPEHAPGHLKATYRADRDDMTSNTGQRAAPSPRPSSPDLRTRQVQPMETPRHSPHQPDQVAQRSPSPTQEEVDNIHHDLNPSRKTLSTSARPPPSSGKMPRSSGKTPSAAEHEGKRRRRNGSHDDIPPRKQPPRHPSPSKIDPPTAPPDTQQRRGGQQRRSTAPLDPTAEEPVKGAAAAKLARRLNEYS